ncbi:unnamed protein product [Coffea canephora]|uniref:Uncharacterized protein n=1 Tax=Coffea canephora TaxID=49390 RepID=A0A068V3B7_COFCA|nr:unnamed protein product [Coffea canephora]
MMSKITYFGAFSYLHQNAFLIFENLKDHKLKFSCIISVYGFLVVLVELLARDNLPG